MFVDVIRASIHDRDKSTIREIVGCLLSAMFVDVIRASIHDRDNTSPPPKTPPHRLDHPMPAEQAVLPQVGLPVLFEGLSATTQYFEQTYNRGKSILEDTLTAFKQDKEAGPSRLKQSERLMHQFRAEKDKAAAFAWAEVANAKRFANDLSVVETRCEQLSTINHQLSSQVSTLETQRAAFDRLTEGEIAELQGAKAKCIVSMRRLFGRGVRLWKR